MTEIFLGSTSGLLGDTLGYFKPDNSFYYFGETGEINTNLYSQTVGYITDYPSTSCLSVPEASVTLNANV